MNGSLRVKPFFSNKVNPLGQGSGLGPLLFKIYLNDLFYLTESTKVCNFADDTTFFSCDENLNSLIKTGT